MVAKLGRREVIPRAREAERNRLQVVALGSAERLPASVEEVQQAAPRIAEGRRG
jgi:hypothetical protein